jgi:hypothetical protein
MGVDSALTGSGRGSIMLENKFLLSFWQEVVMRDRGDNPSRGRQVAQPINACGSERLETR